MKYVYIAGPITRDQDYESKFKEAEKILREYGMIPVNPTKDAPERATYREYIDRGLRILMGCDIICMLPEWNTNSPGARLEYKYAMTVGLPVIQAKRSETGELVIPLL